MTRVEAFSDAVIAIAITLLVVELPFDVVGRGDLLHALAHHWPRFGAYALCFVGLGIMWLHHHAIFRALAHVDRPIALLNMALLLAVAFSPFPTSLVGDYLRRGGADARVAVALFSATWVLMSGTAALMLRHAARHPDLLASDVSPAGVRRLLRNISLACGAYALLTGVALLSPEACLACYCAAAVVFLWGSDHQALRAGPVEERRA